MTRINYGLVDSITREVRYVGQCRNLPSRLQGSHLSASKLEDKPVHLWIRSLAPHIPETVILETLEDGEKRVRTKRSSVSRASVMDAEKQCAAYDEFTNSPELQKRFGMRPIRKRK